jgi:hypothetical protein
MIPRAVAVGTSTFCELSVSNVAVGAINDELESESRSAPASDVKDSTFKNLSPWRARRAEKIHYTTHRRASHARRRRSLSRARPSRAARRGSPPPSARARAADARRPTSRPGTDDRRGVRESEEGSRCAASAYIKRWRRRSRRAATTTSSSATRSRRRSAGACSARSSSRTRGARAVPRSRPARVRARGVARVSAGIIKWRRRPPRRRVASLPSRARPVASPLARVD